MLCATIVAVFFTSFVQGMTVKPIVEWLKVKKQENKEKTVSQEFVCSYIDHMLTGVEDIIGYHGRHWWMQRLARWNDEYLNPILQRNPDTGHDAQLLKVWQEINLADAQNIVMNQTKIGVSADEPADDDDKAMAMMRMILPGYVSKEAASRKSVVHEAVRRASYAVNMPTSERMTEDANMHHVLRDNLYANRKKMEVQGHMKYRRINNVDIDQTSGLVQKQKQEIMIKKQLTTSREQRNTQNRNSLHEAIRRSMRQSFKAADYNQPPPPPARKTVHVARPAQLNSTTFIRNKAKPSSTSTPPTSPLATNSISEPFASEQDDLLPWRRDDADAERSVLNRPQSTFDEEAVKSSRF